MNTLAKTLTFIVFPFIVISLVCPIQPDDFFINTIFTVSGIMFSVGLGLIVTFNMNGVKNKTYIHKLRHNVNKVRKQFILYFFLTTVCYITDKYLRIKELSITYLSFKGIHIKLNWSILLCVIMLYSIVYYVINFSAIQKLNNDIFDKINEQNS